MTFVLRRTLTVAGCLVAIAGCRTAPRDRPVSPQPPPGPSTLQVMRYDDAVALGAQAAQSRGYQEALLQEAQQVAPGLWRVRFRVDREGMLELDFDANTGELLRSEVIPGRDFGLVTPDAGTE